VNHQVCRQLVRLRKRLRRTRAEVVTGKPRLADQGGQYPRETA
jgi:hypothetical protein